MAFVHLHSANPSGHGRTSMHDTDWPFPPQRNRYSRTDVPPEMEDLRVIASRRMSEVSRPESALGILAVLRDDLESHSA
jgi:hypothetical protein